MRNSASFVPDKEKIGAAQRILDRLRQNAAVRPVLRDFKDTIYPFFESDTLFLECCCVLCLVAQ